MKSSLALAYSLSRAECVGMRLGFTLSILKQAKSEESKRLKPKILELKPFEPSSSSKPSQNLELKNKNQNNNSQRVFIVFKNLCCNGSFSVVSRDCRLTRAKHTRTKSEDKIFGRLAEWVRRFSDSHFFDLSATFQTQVQSLKKGVSNSATQDSIMNAHNKTQFTYANIKCALKDSSCDSPISKNLVLTIFALNASSSSTIVFKCHHIRNDSNFTQWFTV
ncbi:hypothetical protein H5410_045046 [Solanum commersonii]|uniref:Uncharacterized protein n=1 Tax=Solanum commersonii TaxID=4109 RepID=A0A9J5XBN1_SOLCO|nr:hypothetical protein H5410_045046 [Solanum commersonii]